jgi:ABC-type multidrug transport system permease subunit
MKIPYFKNVKYNTSGYDQVHPQEPKTEFSIINFIVFITILFVAVLITYGFKTNDWNLLQSTGAFILSFWCWRIFISLTNTTIVFLGEAILALLMLAIIVLCAIYEVQYLFFNC